MAKSSHSVFKSFINDKLKSVSVQKNKEAFCSLLKITILKAYVAQTLETGTPGDKTDKFEYI